MRTFSLPDQTGHTNEFLMTNGLVVSWAAVLGSPLAIGEGIGGSAAQSVLFVDSANKLAEDAGRFEYFPSLGMLRSSQSISVGLDTTYNTGRPAIVFSNGEGATVAPKDRGTIIYNNTRKKFESSVSLGAYRQFISLESGGGTNEIPYFAADGDLTSGSAIQFNGFGLTLTNPGSSGGIPTLGIVSSMAEDIFQVFDRGGVVLNNYATGRVGFTLTDHTGGLQPLLALDDGTQAVNYIWTCTDATTGAGRWSAAGAGTGTIGGSISIHQVAFGDGANSIAGASDFTWDSTSKSFGIGARTSSIGTTNNVASNITAYHSIGALTIPIIGTITGAWNNVIDSATGEVAYVGAGDATAFGFTQHAAIYGHTNAAGDTAIMSAEDVAGKPTLTMSSFLGADPTNLLGFKGSINNTSLNYHFGLNGTGFAIDDTAQTYTLNKLSGTGTRTVTVDPSGTLGTALSAFEIVGSEDADAQTTTHVFSTYTTPNDALSHQYEIGGYANITALVGTTYTLKVDYKDETNSSVTRTISWAPALGSSGLTFTGSFAFFTETIRCYPNTTVIVTAQISGIGSITYNTGYTLKKLN